MYIMSSEEVDIFVDSPSDQVTETTELCENKDLSHGIMLDLLRITLLIYNYGKTFTIDKDVCIEEFVSNLQDTGKLEQMKLNDTRKKVLLEMADKVPTGKIINFITDPDTDIQVGIAVSEGKKRITVVFRGSESISDWYYDLLIMKYKLHDKVCVHSGFHRQLTTNDVHEELIKNIKDILKENPDYNIYVTGHSLGGALSTLFGYILSREIENNIVVVSYASPRVGNYSWKQSFESKENLKHYRITNKRDIVTAFPMYKYHHVGKHIQLSNNKILTFENCDSKKWYEESIFTCWSPSEHNCELYYKRMNNNIW